MERFEIKSKILKKYYLANGQKTKIKQLKKISENENSYQSILNSVYIGYIYRQKFLGNRYLIKNNLQLLTLHKKVL